MNKPDYQAMTRQELKQYVLIHRDDEEAWHEFVNRPRPHAKIYPPNLPPEEIEAILREQLE